MDIRIPRQDGGVTRAYAATPGRPGPGVVVLHAWWGLVKDFRDISDRLAQEGFLTVAPDLFDGRTADSPDDAERLVGDMPLERMVQAARESVLWLANQPSLQPRRLALVGFSLGSWVALEAAAGGLGDAVVTFYGTTNLEADRRIAAPVLGHFAEQDDFEPRAGVTALFRQLEEQGTPAIRTEYPGTVHWFFEPSRPAYNPTAAEDAWQSTLAFLRQHLTP